MTTTADVARTLTERCGARVEDDDAAPALIRLATTSRLVVDVTTRAVVGRYGDAHDATIASVTLEDLRGATDLNRLNETVAQHRSSVPEELADHVRIMDDGWLVFADLVADDTTSTERFESFFAWARSRAAST